MFEAGWLANLAERTGLEPATPGVTGRYSNQLNYRSEFWGANPNGLMNKATSSFVPARLPAGTLIAGRTGRAPPAEPTLNRSTDAGFERCALHAPAARA
jgi:hypothetical protein